MKFCAVVLVLTAYAPVVFCARPDRLPRDESPIVLPPNYEVCTSRRVINVVECYQRAQGCESLMVNRMAWVYIPTKPKDADSHAVELCFH